VKSIRGTGGSGYTRWSSVKGDKDIGITSITSISIELFNSLNAVLHMPSCFQGAVGAHNQ
jgi:hypothetical protein